MSVRDLQVGDLVMLRPEARQANELGLRRWTVTIGQAEARLEGCPDFVQIRWAGAGIVVTRSANVDEVRLFRSVEEQVAERLMGEA